MSEKYAVVVPSNREENFKQFINAWNFEIDVILIEDNLKKTFNVPKNIIHYAWDDIDNELGSASWIFSRRDSAIRSYGFYKAYSKYDYVFTLDDDCFPIKTENFYLQHIKNIEETSKWTESCPGYRTRGIPYQNLGKLKNVVLSVGLWEGIPDLDAVQTLSNQTCKLPEVTKIMPSGQYFPMCGMNLCIVNKILPLMYFPLMGVGVPFRRFDDIWCGIIIKKICDHLNYKISCGKPFIYHSRASNVFVNLEKETPGIIENEILWEVVDNIKLTADNEIDCMIEVGKELANCNRSLYLPQSYNQFHSDYYKKLGEALQIWANLFRPKNYLNVVSMN